jgi:hypothetical protein
LDCWPAIRNNLGITTTTTCYRELKLHSQGADSFDAKNQQRADAAQRVLNALDDDKSALDYEFCGSIQDEGEWSVAEMVKQNSDTIEIILMMDSGDTQMADGGRSYVRRQLDLKDVGVAMPSLGVPIGLLAQQEVLSEDEACVNINEIAEREGWTSRNALKRIWEGVPLDCDQEPDFIK